MWRPRAGRGLDSDRRRARAIHRWMLREPGRCSGCQAVLYKHTTFSRNQSCGSCSSVLTFGRHAYHCESCGRLACKKCTDASRGSSEAGALMWPKPACGGCSGVLVGKHITRVSVNRTCHSCSAAFQYPGNAYHCDSCARITCQRCTWDIRSAARRRSGPMRLTSPVCGITRRTKMLNSLYNVKRPRLSPAAGTAESEVRTKEHHPVDTANADEHEGAHADG